MTEMTAVQKQLADKSANLLKLSANHVKVIDNWRCLKLQSMARITVSGDLKLVATACKLPDKLAEVTRWCKDYFATTSTAAFPALLSKPDDLKIGCEASTLKDQRMLGLVVETKELYEKVAEHWKTKAAAKTTSTGRGEKLKATAD